MKRLGDIATIVMGQSPKGDTYNNDGVGMPLLNGPTEFGSYSPNSTLFTNDSKRECEKGDLIFCVRGSTTGRMNWADRKYSLGRGVCSFRGKSDLETKFVRYAIEVNLEALLKQAGGGTFPNLTKDTINNFEIPYPENAEDMASIANAYDNLIENNNCRVAILEEIAQSLYREWFVKFRFPGHENTKFIDSPLGKVPEGWEVVALQDICERITDGAHKSPKSVDAGIPMASVKDMHDFGLNLSTCRQISEEDYLELARQDSVVKGNDVLIAKDGSYLKHTFVVEKDEKVALLSSIAMLRPNKRVKPHWLAYCLRSENVKERMKQCVSGVAVPRIILKDFRQFKIVLPSNDIQEEWNNAVEKTVKLCWKLIRKNNNLIIQRDLLLPKLIVGSINIE